MLMRNYCFIAAFSVTLVCAFPMRGMGQSAAPAVEVFFGGSRLAEHDQYFSAHDDGLNLAVTGNFNRAFGLETDVNYLMSASVLSPPAFGDDYRFLAGPHVAYNGDRHVSPFAHFLVGVTHGIQNCDLFYVPPPAGCDTGDWILGRNAFTTDVGVGLDVKVFRFFWVRPLQVDYFHDFFSGAGKNKLQLSFGATFRFGSKGNSRGQ
jgi:hypothetical protein